MLGQSSLSKKNPLGPKPLPPPSHPLPPSNSKATDYGVSFLYKVVSNIEGYGG